MKRTTLIILVAAVSIALIIWGLSLSIHRGDNASASLDGNVLQSGRPDHIGLNDPPAPATTVRVLDVGQGDATYIHNGESRVVIDGGPDVRRFGKLLDSLNLNNSTIDVVILSHQHIDHYHGLLALFDSRRHIKIRYFFENKDPSAASTLARLRDSILARVDRDSLIYRDTDDPCANGAPTCTITMNGGAKLRLMRPKAPPEDPNNRSVAVKLIAPDSAFTMWLAGDAEHDEIADFESEGFIPPGTHVDILKADHHGSCNGVTPEYLERLHPTWAVASLAAHNDYGHMHEQAKAAYKAAGVPWYRTDQNGTITIRSPGTAGSHYTIAIDRGTRDMNGPSDKYSRQAECADM